MNTTTSTITKRDLLYYRREVRRQNLIRRRICFSILAVFMILILAISYNVIVAEANDDMSDVSYKYYTYYEVSKGETLWSIAQDNIDYKFYDSINDYIDEVMYINHLTNDVIKSGEKIVIPYYSNLYY